MGRLVETCRGKIGAKAEEDQQRFDTQRSTDLLAQQEGGRRRRSALLYVNERGRQQDVTECGGVSRLDRKSVV